MVYILPNSGTFVIIHKSTLTHHGHQARSFIFQIGKSIMMCNYYVSIIQNRLIALKIHYVLHIHSLHSMVKTYILHSIIFLISKCLILRIIKNVAFAHWLLSLSHTHYRFYHILFLFFFFSAE